MSDIWAGDEQRVRNSNPSVITHSLNPLLINHSLTLFSVLVNRIKIGREYLVNLQDLMMMYKSIKSGISLPFYSFCMCHSVAQSITIIITHVTKGARTPSDRWVTMHTRRITPMHYSLTASARAHCKLHCWTSNKKLLNPPSPPWGLVSCVVCE
jgi:hypothetical protein